MYSYEDRIRAGKLYLKLGKRLAATVRQLGYPTTKSLEHWYHTYERCLDLPKERICLRPRYSEEQKKAATDLLWTTENGTVLLPGLADRQHRPVH